MLNFKLQSAAASQLSLAYMTEGETASVADQKSKKICLPIPLKHTEYVICNNMFVKAAQNTQKAQKV